MIVWQTGQGLNKTSSPVTCNLIPETGVQNTQYNNVIAKYKTSQNV